MTEIDISEVLTEREIDLLLAARDRHDPVVIEREAVENAKQVLGAALEDRGVRDADRMPLAALAAQFRDEDGELALESLSQQPETGGAGADEINSDGDGVGELSADEKREIRERLEVADRMADRTPQYASELRQEAATLAGVDSVEEIDVEAL